MWTLAAEVERAIRAAGVAIEGVSIGASTDKSTWTVTPATQQGAAQPAIDAFVIGAQATTDADIAADAAASAAQKDLIATMAVIVSRTDASWGTYSLPQKIAAVRAAVTSWKTLRAFVETNL